MTTIRTTCNRCGDIELTTADLTLELTAVGSTGQYRFECPYCDAVQRRAANQRVVSILLATGVRYELASTEGPITEEEISAFASALDDEGWFTRLTASS